MKTYKVYYAVHAGGYGYDKVTIECAKVTHEDRAVVFRNQIGEVLLCVSFHNLLYYTLVET